MTNRIDEYVRRADAEVAVHDELAAKQCQKEADAIFLAQFKCEQQQRDWWEKHGHDVRPM